MQATTHKTISEKMKDWKGRVTFTSLKVVGEEAERLEKMLSEAVEMPKEIFDRHFARLVSLCEVREATFDNLIVSVGRQVFARILANDTTYTGIVNYGAVGTGTTIVLDGDTVLDTEIKRKGVATRSRSGTTVTLRFFYSKSDFAATVEEFGSFIDGTGTVDTGQMFNRVLTGGWVKSALEALTVTAQFDLNPQP